MSDQVKKIPHKRLSKRQRSFLSLFEANRGNTSKACRAMGLSRNSAHRWMNNNQNFVDRVEEVREGLIDRSEDALYKRIGKGDTQAILFHLKTKGKDRGYVEKTQVDTHHSGVIGLGDALEEIDGRDTGLPQD